MVRFHIYKQGDHWEAQEVPVDAWWDSVVSEHTSFAAAFHWAEERYHIFWNLNYHVRG